MIHYQIDILLIHAAVVNQNNAPVGRNALHDPPCRRAVMQEIARKTRLSVPLPQLAALFEEFGFSRRFHEMDRKWFVALRADLPEKGILHGVDRVRGQRSFGIAEQTPLFVRRVGMQPEDFGESTVRQAAAGFTAKAESPLATSPTACIPSAHIRASAAAMAAARSCSLNCPRTRPIDRAKAAKPPSWAIAPRR